MKKFILLITALLLAESILAQNSIEPAGKPVYEFLERMTLKGIITADEFVKPLLRKNIGEYLLKIKAEESLLSAVEKKEFEWYESEYFKEVYKMEYSQPQVKEGFFTRINNRFRFYYYDDSLFTFYFTPQVILNYQKAGDENFFHRGWGFSSYGSIGENFGFRIDFDDNNIDNFNYIKFNEFYRVQGQTFIERNTNKIEFSRSNGSMIFSNNWLTLGALKENFELGSGISSQLILSSKAPSFPSLYMRINPVKWFSFYMFHGWLKSNVVDSALSYTTNFNNNIRWVEKDKYIALHALQLNPFANLSFTAGESIIYSDRTIYFGYFIPFLFYRSVDHMFTYGKGESGNNGSFFFDISHYPLSNLKYYLTLYIDELSLAKLLKRHSDSNQLGYTAGISVYEPFVDNLKLSFEYTRILPWVYSNWILSQTYTNAGYLMGHYIGQNADQLFVQADYRLLRGLEFKLWGEYFKKGGIVDITNQYTTTGGEFLYGLRRNEFNLGFCASYEFIHDGFLKTEWQYSSITDEDKTRTPDWQLGKNHTFSLAVYYGM